MRNEQGPRIWYPFPSKEGESTVRPCFHQEASLTSSFHTATMRSLPTAMKCMMTPNTGEGAQMFPQIKTNALNSPQIKRGNDPVILK